MSKRAVGKAHEQLAGEYLQRQGCIILEKNFRNRQGEIDLIVRDGRYLVFVEVKYRRNGHLGVPEEAVDFHKQAKIRQVAAWYLYARHLPEDTPCRFDVVSMLGNELRWIRNAF